MLKTKRVKMTRTIAYKIASTVFGVFCTHRTIQIKDVKEM
jgi:hypothetical protein